MKIEVKQLLDGRGNGLFAVDHSGIVYVYLGNDFGWRQLNMEAMDDKDIIRYQDSKAKRSKGRLNPRDVDIDSDFD